MNQTQVAKAIKLQAENAARRAQSQHDLVCVAVMLATQLPSRQQAERFLKQCGLDSDPNIIRLGEVWRLTHPIIEGAATDGLREEVR